MPQSHHHLYGSNMRSKNFQMQSAARDTGSGPSRTYAIFLGLRIILKFLIQSKKLYTVNLLVFNIDSKFTFDVMVLILATYKKKENMSVYT